MSNNLEFLQENFPFLTVITYLKQEYVGIVQNADSLFLNTTSLNVADYQFKVNPINFDASVSSCKLVDRFLNIETISK